MLAKVPRYPRPAVSAEHVRYVLRDLYTRVLAEDGTPIGEAKPGDVRRALAATLSVEWRARPSELCALRWPDLTDDDQWATITRRVQRTPLFGPEELLPVSVPARALFAAWRPHHDALTANVGGGRVHHVFVTLKTNQRSGSKYVKGMPLLPRGLEDDWSKYVGRLNGAQHLDDWPGPLAYRLEAWRRSGARGR